MAPPSAPTRRTRHARAATRNSAEHLAASAISPISPTRLVRVPDTVLITAASPLSSPPNADARDARNNRAGSIRTLAARAGDHHPGSVRHRDEFDRLYREHQPAIFRAATRLARNETEAWDLTQDTFERALHAYAGYRPEGRALAWLRTILRRLFIDRRRQRRRMTGLDEDRLEAPRVDEEAPLWLTVDEADLERALAGLPLEQRRLLEASAFERQSYASLAAQGRVQTATIGSRLHRIRAALRGALVQLGRTT